jgi:hypothetical protein
MVRIRPWMNTSRGVVLAVAGFVKVAANASSDET